MHVVAPTWRSTGDISMKDDVMEEVARLYGYDQLRGHGVYHHHLTGAINQKEQDLVRNIKEYLAIRCGMQEVYTYPWMKDVFVNAVLQTTEGMLKAVHAAGAGSELYPLLPASQPLRGGCEE